MNKNIKNCSTGELGGFIFLSEKSKLKIFDSSFTQSSARFGGIIAIQENYGVEAIIINCNFNNNHAINSLIDVSIGTLLIQNCVFLNNYNILLASTQSSVNLINITLEEHQCSLQDVGCFLNIKQQSQLIAILMNVSKVKSLVGEGNAFIESSKVSFDFCNMTNFYSFADQGNCVSFYSSMLEIKNSFFFGFQRNCLYSTSKSNITIENTSFYSNNDNEMSTQTQKFGIIYCMDCLIFIVKNSIFAQSKQSLYGGAVYLLTSKKINYYDAGSQTALIENSLFLNNNVKIDGGALFVFDQNITLIGNNFTKNKAQNSGGAVFLDNSG